jgi:hypothetical protein
VQPTYRAVQVADPVAYVVSLNLKRRHLTPSQRSLCAARAREVYDRQAKERQRLSEGRGKKGPANLPDLKGDARDQVGKAFGVSGRSVDYASEALKAASARGLDDLFFEDQPVKAPARRARRPVLRPRVGLAVADDRRDGGVGAASAGVGQLPLQTVQA